MEREAPDDEAMKLGEPIGETPDDETMKVGETTVEATLTREANRMSFAPGMRQDEEMTSQAELQRSEFQALSTELESKSHAFVVENKILDKRDLVGRPQCRNQV